VKVEGEKANIVVSVPALEDAPLAGTSANTVMGAEVGAPNNGRRTLGWVVAGTGVIGLGVGTAFAIHAKSKYDDSLPFCRPDDKNKCFQEGITLREDSRRAGNIATLVVGAGAAAVIAGAVLLLTAPSSIDKPRAALVPSVGPDVKGLAVVGTY
jgi:hypothetical protein